MRFIWMAVSVLVCVALGGCLARPRPKKVEIPPVKRTVTVTETIKTEQPVPVYQTQTTLESTTKTVGGGPDLHRAEVKPLDQPAAK